MLLGRNTQLICNISSRNANVLIRSVTFNPDLMEIAAYGSITQWEWPFPIKM